MLVLAFDAGGPWVDVALARDGALVAELRSVRDGAQGDLLRTIAELLERSSSAPGDLDGVVALIGPGSFTGTRVACSAALGIAAATGAPATGVSTFEAFALDAAERGDARILAGATLAVVDALRGDWFTQRYAGDDLDSTRASGEPALARADEIDLAGVARIVGHDTERFAARLVAAGREAPTLVPSPRPAAVVARAASRQRWPWDPAPLSAPLYLRPPATTPPK